MYTNDRPSKFVKEEIAAAIQIWNRAAVSLLDIRHKLISPQKSVRSYRLPASAFIFTSGGKAEVLLDDTAYNVERFGLFHGGKGTELTITPHCDWLEIYTVLYKAGEPSAHKGEYLRLMEQINPFRQQYGFMPHNPLFFSEELRRMYEKWKGATPLNLFYGKTAFYRFVYEIYEELEQGQIHVFEPDIVAMAKRFLDAHYSETIVVRELCHMLGVSYSHFHRSFKQQLGSAPQDYLIKARLAAAKQWLETSDASVREIAHHCGFADEYSLYRLFIKNIGVAPSVYRESSQSNMIDCSIGTPRAFSYNEESQVSLGELKRKGANEMFKQMRGKAVVAAALSLMLLMSACSAAPVNTGAPESTPTPAVTEQGSQQPQATQPVEAGTKTVSTVKGDVEIPQNPKRIVVMNYAFGDVLALGVTPAAVNDYWAIEGSAVEGLLKDVPRATNPEEIMSIEPDLIITAYEKDEEYEKLRKIAPTVSFGTAKETTQQTLDERLTFLSDVLGVEQAVKEKVLFEHNTLIEQARKTLMDAGFGDKTFTLATNSMEEPGVVVASYKGAQALYVDLGMKRSEKGQEIFETGEWYAGVSLEVLPEYCGDYLILFGDGQNNDFLGNGVYESIDAVKNGNVILMNEYLSTFNDVISVSSQIDFFVEAIMGISEQN